MHESFKTNGVDDFVGQKLTKWNDELIMQFYSTAHFYPDGWIVWMTEGQRHQSSVDEWARLINHYVIVFSSTIIGATTFTSTGGLYLNHFSLGRSM